MQFSLAPDFVTRSAPSLLQRSSWSSLGFPTCRGLHGPSLMNPTAAANPTLHGRQLLGGWNPGTEALVRAPCEFVELGEQSLWKSCALSLPLFWRPQIPCATKLQTADSITSALYRINYAQYFYCKSFKIHMHCWGTRGGDSRASESSATGEFHRVWFWQTVLSSVQSVPYTDFCQSSIVTAHDAGQCLLPAGANPPPPSSLR